MATSLKDSASVISVTAGVAFTDKLYYIAHMDTDGDAVLAGAGEACLGVIVEENAVDKPATVQIGGVAKVVAGAAITAGAEVASDANGKAVTASGAGTKTLGVALESATGDGTVIEVLIDRSILHA